MNANAEAGIKRGHTSAAISAYPKVRENFVRELHIKRGSTETEPENIQHDYQWLLNKKFSGKKIVDIVFGILAFFAFLITYPFIALGIKCFSRGPVIFKQKRTGRNGKEFTCYKFRTMHQIKLRRIDGKPIITKQGDRRVFAFGNFLRKTSLDELPQIINVLKGEMSLIGPRPYPVNECSYWNNTFNDFYYRYAVKPGITGLAQINGYRGGTLDQHHMRKRLNYDLTYLENYSITTDLKIVGKTFAQVVNPSATAH